MSDNWGDAPADEGIEAEPFELDEGDEPDPRDVPDDDELPELPEREPGRLFGIDIADVATNLAAPAIRAAVQKAITAAVKPLADPAVDIATLAGVITDEEEKTAPSVVKLVGSEIAPGHMRALYFTRATAPYGEGPLYHHVGLYAYRRAALDRFVSLPQSPLELREKLEQLRALEDGMRIDVMVIDHVPRGVDTPPDLDRARAILKSR